MRDAGETKLLSASPGFPDEGSGVGGRFFG